MSDTIRVSVEKLKEYNFFHFDSFLIEKMLGKEIGELQKDGAVPLESRKRAYRIFCKKLGVHQSEIGAVQTIQKWFGIHGMTTPDRETVFQICFALRLSEREVSDYLLRGIGEPDFQINDYRETIFLYCYHRGMDYEAALDMIHECEQKMPVELELYQYTNTNELMRDYYVNCELNRDEFLAWMLIHAGDFKGYSKTALEYFKLLKSEILLEVKEDASQKLKEHLKETDFYEWEKSRHFSVKRRRYNIPKYVRFASARKENCLSEVDAKHIMELCKMSYLNVNSNAELLIQVFDNVSSRVRNFKTNNRADTKKQRFAININLMNDKHLSDMLNIVIHKDRDIRFSLISCQLELFLEEEACPPDIVKILKEYGCPERDCRTVGSVQRWLKMKKKDEKRRCVQIQRNDLLPLIQCIALKRYSRQIGDDEDYVAEQAKEAFVRQANLILTACNMEPFNPGKYELDAVLSQCYQKNDYYFLAEVLDALAETAVTEEDDGESDRPAVQS